MQNLSAADRQISASTIGQYRAMATPYRDGTWDHDVSQNIQTLLAAITGVPPYRILDLGCGPGRDLVTFRDLGHAVVGLDGCPEFVTMARAVSGCEVWQEDLLAMTLPPASFDGVFANAVLFHVPSRALPGVLARLHASLKPGGALLASNPRGQDEEGFVEGRYACFYSFKTWCRLVSGSGFSLVDHYFRPPGKPRHQQPWLATLWRKPATPEQRGAASRCDGCCEPGATPATVRTLSSHPHSAPNLRKSAAFRPSNATDGAKCEPGIAACR
jgi:SAM-dependent methyltransferase